MSASAPPGVRAVLTALPAEIVITDPDILPAYAGDQSRLTTRATPAAVVTPRTTGEVSACLATAHRHGVPVVPRGAGSGLSGGANPPTDAIVLSLHRMAAIVETDPANRLIVVQPGVVTGTLRKAAAAVDLYYPPDPGSVEFSTIGGNIATNAGGMCCVKYGVTGDFVLGLEVVLADGRILRTGRRTVKGVAGYDLTHLFVGSEGTLGVVTEAVLRLVPKPRPPHTLVAPFGTLSDAGQAVAGIIGAGITPSMLEILDRTTIRAVDRLTRMGLGDDAALLLIQSDDPHAVDALSEIEQICIKHAASEVYATSDPTEGAMLLEARRLALPALEKLGDWLLDDVSVPRTEIASLMARIERISRRSGLTIGVFGHAGDGNLHPTIIYDAGDPASCDAARTAFDSIVEEALRLGGTVTGEHGVGRLKRQWLATELGSVGVATHYAIKAALDPTGILNPQAVLVDHTADISRRAP
ncbi:FAD-binding protein [Streptomyces sp. NBC_00075]|uniref:FAD-binding oxidoreductase n=1 Tax=Streptomyces sp. NBC_00075 TaxID=2975641 RepID=UPI00325518E3